jgi:uncharacterized membrane-anchored protein
MKQLRNAVLALAIFSLASAASAQVPAGYMTVDAVSVGLGSPTVTGVVQGDATPSTRTFQYNMGTLADQASAREACHRLLLLALSKPGQYVALVGANVCTVALVKP